jgi:hypothetical protein
MRVRPRQYGSWLFPVMVVTAALVVGFGALGLAVITGHMRGGAGGAPGQKDGALVTADANSANPALTAKAQPGAGLTGRHGQN